MRPDVATAVQELISPSHVLPPQAAGYGYTPGPTPGFGADEFGAGEDRVPASAASPIPEMMRMTVKHSDRSPLAVVGWGSPELRAIEHRVKTVLKGARPGTVGVENEL